MRNKLSKIRIQLRESSFLRRRRRRKLICKKFNIARNRAGRRIKKGIKSTKNGNGKFSVGNGTQEVFPPINFTIDNIDEVLDFIYTTYRKGNKQQVKRIYVRMDNVVQIDMYAICLLLSLINKLGRIQKFCMGNYPNNEEARDFLINSGFLSVMKSSIVSASSKKFHNQMYMIGKNRVQCSRIGESVKETMEEMTGTAQKYPPVYEIMTEICANSVEHANSKEGDKNWLVSISKNDEGKMHFILTDSGCGILKTLRRKKYDMFKDLLRSGTEILTSVFHKEYQSVTGEVNRHKGLPSIYEAYEEGFISDLFVLTNDVICDFSNNDSKITDKEFMGTMISWTITIENFVKWKNSICM